MVRCMDRLEVQGSTLNSFLEFEKLFIYQNTPLDNKNIARCKLQELQECIFIHKYITAFDNVLVVLPELAREDATHSFVYGLKPHLRDFFKA